MRITFDFTKEEKEMILKSVNEESLKNLRISGVEKKPKHEWHMMPELPKVGQTVMIFMAKYDIMAKAVLRKRRSRPRWYFRTSPKDGQPLNFDLNEVTMWKELDPDQKFPEDMDK